MTDAAASIGDDTSERELDDEQHPPVDDQMPYCSHLVLDRDGNVISSWPNFSRSGAAAVIWP